MEMSVAGMADEVLVREVAAVVARGNQLTARLLVYLAEVERRDLHLREGCSSLFAYCVERLGMAEGAAYKRVWAARVGRRFPLVLEMIAAGQIHLTGVHLLARHLTDENHAALLARAEGKTRREIEKLVAEIAPRPEVPSRVAALPRRVAAAPAGSGSCPGGDAIGICSRSNLAVAGDCSVPPPVVLPGSVGGKLDLPIETRTFAPAAEPPASVEPLAPRRYQVRVTVGEEAHGALRQLQDLLSHELPGGDPAAIIERALAALLEQTLARKAALTRRPRSASPARPADRAAGEEQAPARSRHIPAATRRAVWSRDGARCTHVDTRGRRCTSRRFLELHHREPWARGGEHSTDNLQLRCRAHNQYQATLDDGADFIAAKRPPRAREPSRPIWLHRRQGPSATRFDVGASTRRERGAVTGCEPGLLSNRAVEAPWLQGEDAGGDSTPDDGARAGRCLRLGHGSAFRTGDHR